MSEPELRGLARRVAARAQIRDVRLIKSDVELEDIPAEGHQLTYNLNVTAGEVDWEPGQELFAVRITYEVSLGQFVIIDESEDEGPSEVERSIASINFTMAALFELSMRQGEKSATEQELSAYAETTGGFALYPFAREYVYDLTGRLRLPALTLPVHLVAVTQDEPID